MTVPKGHWIQCTPGFLEAYPNACGSTVRRPTLDPLPGHGDAVYEAIGHEHLLVRFASGHSTPLEHESGGPA